MSSHPWALLTRAALALLGGVWLTAGVAAQERDPFVFGPRMGAVEQSGLVFVGILWDATRPLAIIGEATVATGDAVGEWHVVDIRPDGIIIQSGEHRERLIPGDAIPLMFD